MERQTQTIQRKADASLPFTVERRKDIPEAPLYVSANIRSLSGWGEAEGKTTRGVFPVPNREIALKVMDKVKDVLDGKRCNICGTRPEVRPATTVVVVFDWEAFL